MNNPYEDEWKLLGKFLSEFKYEENSTGDPLFEENEISLIKEIYIERKLTIIQIRKKIRPEDKKNNHKIDNLLTHLYRDKIPKMQNKLCRSHIFNTKALKDYFEDMTKERIKKRGVVMNILDEIYKGLAKGTGRFINEKLTIPTEKIKRVIPWKFREIEYDWKIELRGSVRYEHKENCILNLTDIYLDKNGKIQRVICLPFEIMIEERPYSVCSIEFSETGDIVWAQLIQHNILFKINGLELKVGNDWDEVDLFFYPSGKIRAVTLGSDQSIGPKEYEKGDIVGFSEVGVFLGKMEYSDSDMLGVSYE